jgi:hypothetical protein
VSRISPHYVAAAHLLVRLAVVRRRLWQLRAWVMQVVQRLTGQTSWGQTRVFVQWRCTLVWQALADHAVAIPHQLGALMSLLIVAEYNETPFAAPYFMLLVMYCRAWFNVAGEPNVRRMQLLHQIIAVYASIELFLKFSSNAPPIARQ